MKSIENTDFKNDTFFQITKERAKKHSLYNYTVYTCSGRYQSDSWGGMQ